MFFSFPLAFQMLQHLTPRNLPKHPKASYMSYIQKTNLFFLFFFSIVSCHRGNKNHRWPRQQRHVDHRRHRCGGQELQLHPRGAAGTLPGGGFPWFCLSFFFFFKAFLIYFICVGFLNVFLGLFSKSKFCRSFFGCVWAMGCFFCRFMSPSFSWCLVLRYIFAGTFQICLLMFGFTERLFGYHVFVLDFLS